MNTTFNKIIALENEVQEETKEMIRKSNYKKWFEEEGNRILECFWEVDKTLTLKEIRALLPSIIEKLKEKQNDR